MYQTVCKVSGHSAKCPDSLENIRTFWNVSVQSKVSCYVSHGKHGMFALLAHLCRKRCFMRHLKKKRKLRYIYRFDNFFSRPIMATFCFLLLSDSYIKCLTPPSHSHKEVFGPFLFKDRNPKEYF